MIQLKYDCLIFQTHCGHQVPCSAEWAALELIGDASPLADPELIRHAAAAVLHYFKHELNRQFVSVGEFAGALDCALRSVGLSLFGGAELAPARVMDSQLPELMKSAGKSGELFFFPELRRELRRQLEEAPQMVRFNGLRPCVKQLAGANRWGPRCENLSDQIVEYLRTCWQSDTSGHPCTMVVK
jgi:hypothetical protein